MRQTSAMQDYAAELLEIYHEYRLDLIRWVKLSPKSWVKSNREQYEKIRKIRGHKAILARKKYHEIATILGWAGDDKYWRYAP